MSLLLDQNMPNQILKALRQWGYTVSLLAEHISPEADDPDVLALALQLDAVLLTCDLDFSDIRIYPPDHHQGIIVFRYRVGEEAQVLATLKSALNDLYRNELRQTLVIIEATRYRLRQK
jgi:predicted nuclease of predicted toxin-antitoxin system